MVSSPVQGGAAGAGYQAMEKSTGCNTTFIRLNEHELLSLTTDWERN